MAPKKGIVRKTFLFSSLLIVLVILLSFSVLYFVMPGYYLRQKEQTLQDNLNILIAMLKNSQNDPETMALISDFVAVNNANVLSFDKDGLILPNMSSPFVSMMESDKENSHFIIMQGSGKGEPGEEPLTVLIQQSSFISGSENVDNVQMRTHLGAFKQERVISLTGNVGGDMLDYLIVSGTLQPIDEAKNVILSLIPWVLVAGIALGLVLSWIYARQISKPVLRISGAAVKMRDMEPGAVSGVRTNDELGELSQNLDNLYGKLLENIENLRDEMEQVNRLERSRTEMMRSASHELKTPVAALSGMLDGMIDNVGVYKDRNKYLAECRGQVDKLSRLVWEILNASKADSPAREPEKEEVDVSRLMDNALEEYDCLAEQKKLRISKELPSFTIVTDPELLHRVFANLISNAMRYTPEGGEVRVILSDRRLSVENQCDPIPDSELQQLFEPFYTRNASRDKSLSGTGLGLYIVKCNLERLGLSYFVDTTDMGLKLTVAL